MLDPIGASVMMSESWVLLTAEGTAVYDHIDDELGVQHALTCLLGNKQGCQGVTTMYAWICSHAMFFPLIISLFAKRANSSSHRPFQLVFLPA
jgi:hypothetical protein